jgi:hypothetical protein
MCNRTRALFLVSILGLGLISCETAPQAKAPPSLATEIWILVNTGEVEKALKRCDEELGKTRLLSAQLGILALKCEVFHHVGMDEKATALAEQVMRDYPTEFMALKGGCVVALWGGRWEQARSRGNAAGLGAKLETEKKWVASFLLLLDALEHLRRGEIGSARERATEVSHPELSSARLAVLAALEELEGRDRKSGEEGRRTGRDYILRGLHAKKTESKPGTAGTTTAHNSSPPPPAARFTVGPDLFLGVRFHLATYWVATFDCARRMDLRIYAE